MMLRLFADAATPSPETATAQTIGLWVLAASFFVMAASHLKSLFSKSDAKEAVPRRDFDKLDSDLKTLTTKVNQDHDRMAEFANRQTTLDAMSQMNEKFNDLRLEVSGMYKAINKDMHELIGKVTDKMAKQLSENQRVMIRLLRRRRKTKQTIVPASQ